MQFAGDFELQIRFAKRHAGRARAGRPLVRNFRALLNDGFDVVAGDHARIRDHFAFAVGFQRADFQVDETAHAGIEQTDRKARRINATGTDQCGKVNHAVTGRRCNAQTNECPRFAAQLLTLAVLLRPATGTAHRNEPAGQCISNRLIQHPHNHDDFGFDSSC